MKTNFYEMRQQYFENYELSQNYLRELDNYDLSQMRLKQQINSLKLALNKSESEKHKLQHIIEQSKKSYEMRIQSLQNKYIKCKNDHQSDKKNLFDSLDKVSKQLTQVKQRAKPNIKANSKTISNSKHTSINNNAISTNQQRTRNSYINPVLSMLYVTG